MLGALQSEHELKPNPNVRVLAPRLASTLRDHPIRRAIIGSMRTAGINGRTVTTATTTVTVIAATRSYTGSFGIPNGSTGERARPSRYQTHHIANVHRRGVGVRREQLLRRSKSP